VSGEAGFCPVLAHFYRWPAALAIALPKLKEQGYSFVTVSELLKAGKPVIAARCYQTSPGDMTRIARSSPPDAAAMTSSPFSAVPIELEAAGGMPARLLPLDQGSCASLAAGIVAMEPWSVMNYPADKLAAFLASPGGGVARYVVSVNGEESGVVAVRYPWLKGPYLELLALLPPAQNQGLGSSIMAWFESAGLKHGARNLWVCASSFNARALRFYERQGFTRAATLPGLVANGYDEILLRKFPLGSQP
jgi:ribosomal protein S18 acetylase RimI-like enzyme